MEGSLTGFKDAAFKIEIPQRERKMKSHEINLRPDRSFSFRIASGLEV